MNVLDAGDQGSGLKCAPRQEPDVIVVTLGGHRLRHSLRMQTLTFPATFLADTGGYVISFRDIPEALTQGDTLEEAEAMAADALRTCVDFYLEDGRPLPTPSARLPGERMITFTVSDGPAFGPDHP